MRATSGVPPPSNASGPGGDSPDEAVVPSGQGEDDELDRLSLSEAPIPVALALASVFLVLGALVVPAPLSGAALFGIPAPAGPGVVYLPAIGFRDVALALPMIGLACFSTRRALRVVLG